MSGELQKSGKGSGLGIFQGMKIVGQGNLCSNRIPVSVQ